MLLYLTKVPRTLLNRYNNYLLQSPYKTKMATAGFTYFLADCICQTKIEKKESNEYSITRSLRQSSVGAFFAAPSLHVWHSLILPKVVKFCSGKISKLLISVLLNETVLAGYFISCLLFSFEALKTHSVHSATQNVQEKFVPAINASVRFWTGISFINYGLIPIHLRPVFVSCWSVVWQSYLSYVSNNAVNSQTSSLIDLDDYSDAEVMSYSAMPLLK